MEYGGMLCCGCFGYLFTCPLIAGVFGTEAGIPALGFGPFEIGAGP